MKEMNTREKNLSMFTFVSCLFLAAWGINNNLKKKIIFLKDEIVGEQEKLVQANQLLSTVPVVSASTPDANPMRSLAAQVLPVYKRPTILILNDISSPLSYDKIRILSAEKSAENGYRLSVEGEFIEMMRYFSFLERSDGKFLISTVNISKGGGSGVQASIQLVMRGT